MQADQPEQTEDVQTGPHKGPWAWPRWMLGEILQLHDLGNLFTRGLTRRAASMLARFLWSTEAIVRRLLLAAAFSLKVTPKEASARHRPDQKTQAPPEQPEQDKTKQPRASFRIFAIRGAPRDATQTVDADRAIVLRPDLGAMPLDPLLRIGADALPPRKTAGRRSTRAARFRTPLSAEEQERRFCLKKDRLNAAYDLPSPPMRPASGPQRDPFAQSRSRRYFEDQPNPLDDRKLRPAGMLARRITALIRVLDNPDSAAQRLAAMLARRANFPQRLAGLGPPIYTRSENDRLPRPPGLAEMLEAHRAFSKAVPNDSS